MAAIGDLKLESGAVLCDCKVGFRTYSTLDARKDNAVLAPTWYLGKSGDYGTFNKGSLVDSAKYYVENTKRENAVASLSGFENALLAWDVYDMDADMEAYSTQDVFKPF